LQREVRRTKLLEAWERQRQAAVDPPLDERTIVMLCRFLLANPDVMIVPLHAQKQKQKHEASSHPALTAIDPYFVYRLMQVLVSKVPRERTTAAKIAQAADSLFDQGLSLTEARQYLADQYGKEFTTVERAHQRRGRYKRNRKKRKPTT
jgi:hypothetical protein